MFFALNGTIIAVQFTVTNSCCHSNSYLRSRSTTTKTTTKGDENHIPYYSCSCRFNWLRQEQNTILCSCSCGFNQLNMVSKLIFHPDNASKQEQSTEFTFPLLLVGTSWNRLISWNWSRGAEYWPPSSLPDIGSPLQHPHGHTSNPSGEPRNPHGDVISAAGGCQYLAVKMAANTKLSPPPHGQFQEWKWSHEMRFVERFP
jgi:hypothetical protein